MIDRIAAVLILTVASLGAPASAAQNTTVFSLDPGVRVRIHPFGGGGNITGAIDRVSFDTVFLAIDGVSRPSILSVTLDRIVGLDVADGRTNYVGPFAAVGFALGAVSTLAYNGVRKDVCRNCTSISILAPVIAIGAGVIGGLIGSLASGDRWRPVTLPPRSRRRNPPLSAGFSKIRILRGPSASGSSVRSPVLPQETPQMGRSVRDRRADDYAGETDFLVVG